jgi:hypothetical protein
VPPILGKCLSLNISRLRRALVRSFVSVTALLPAANLNPDNPVPKLGLHVLRAPSRLMSGRSTTCAGPYDGAPLVDHGTLIVARRPGVLAVDR